MSDFVSSSSSCFSSGYEKEEEFDVFVCFTGKTRGGFTSHLVKELKQAGLKVFTDELLPRGEVISDALIGGIQRSRSTMVVISKDFAASGWCLDEVVESFRWKEEKARQHGRHLIFPIFYKVDPSELRHLRGITHQYLALQEEKYGRNSDKVAWWKTCLVLLSNIAGWHLTNDGNESALIQIIVKEIQVIVKEVGKPLRMKNALENLLHAMHAICLLLKEQEGII